MNAGIMDAGHVSSYSELPHRSWTSVFEQNVLDCAAASLHKVCADHLVPFVTCNRVSVLLTWDLSFRLTSLGHLFQVILCMELWLMTGILVSGFTFQGRRLSLKLSICTDLLWTTLGTACPHFHAHPNRSFLSLISCCRRWQ